MDPATQLEALRRDFDRDGFVDAGVVLTTKEVRELQTELERYADTEFRGLAHAIERPAYAGNLSDKPEEKHFQIGGIWQVSEPFRRLALHPRIAEIAAHLTGSPVMQFWCDTVQYKPPKEGAPFHWHQDGPYHLSIEPPERLIGAWVALDDAELDSGCMWMVPGSHRWGPREPHLWSFRKTTHELDDFANLAPPADSPEAVKDWRAPVPCPLRAGSVHFHHAHTWHGSPTNRSGRPRRGYSIFLMPEGTRATGYEDPRVTVPRGTAMLEAGPNFPVVYRAPTAA